jgi:hypothetical protein
VLALAAATGRYEAMIYVAVAFVGGTVYSCWYWRDRLREQDGEEGQ